MGHSVTIPLQVNQKRLTGVTIRKLPAKMRDGSQTVKSGSRCRYLRSRPKSPPKKCRGKRRWDRGGPFFVVQTTERLSFFKALLVLGNGSFFVPLPKKIMKEKISQQSGYQTEILRREESTTFSALATEYATSFWAGAWKELLIDSEGNQYGTYGQDGEIYPETATLLSENNLTPFSDWPVRLWQLAGEGKLFQNGLPLRQFWSLERASEELLGFIAEGPTGYGGEILLLKDGSGQIAGFTAYTVGREPQTGRYLAQKRFPYQELVLPDSKPPLATTLEELLNNLYPEKKIGIYLDFAISENKRGRGLGSQLFDLRLNRLVELGTEVIVGRTIKTSPAQYYGNYLARGMTPIAYDPTNPDKAVFAIKVDEIKPRLIKS